MTVEELEGKLTSIYHEFAETISENETDEQIVARSKGTVCKTVFRGFESHSRFYTNLFAYGQKIKKRAF